MPEEAKPDAHGALQRAGLIKSTTPAPVVPPVEGAPPAPVVPAVLPDFGAIPQNPPQGVQHAPQAPDPAVLESLVASQPKSVQEAFKVQREKIKVLEGQLKSADRSQDLAKIKEFELKLEQAYDQIAEMDLVRDPRFQEQFETPKQKLVADMKIVLEQYGVEADEVIKAIQGKPFAEQMAYLKENAQDASGAMLNLIREMNRIDETRTSKLTNKQAAKQELLARQMESDKALHDQAFEIVLKSEAESGEQLLKEIPGEEGYNENVRKLRAYARSLATDNSPMSRATLAVKAAKGDVYKTLYQHSQAALLTMQNQFKALGKTIPQTSGARAPVSNESAPEGRLSAAEAARRVAQRM